MMSREQKEIKARHTVIVGKIIQCHEGENENLNL